MAGILNRRECGEVQKSLGGGEGGGDTLNILAAILTTCFITHSLICIIFLLHKMVKCANVVRLNLCS